MADALVQTSVGETKRIDGAPVESHIEVSLERFEEVLLSGKQPSAELDEAVESVLQNPNFQGWMENYFRDIEDNEDDTPDPERDSSEDLMDAFNMIMTSYPESDDTRPYNLRFLTENHFVARPEPHELPQAAAIIDSGSGGPWDWGNIALFIQFATTEFESSLEELRQVDTDRFAKAGSQPYTVVLDPGRSRPLSPPRKRDASPSASNDGIHHPKRARRQSSGAEHSGGAKGTSSHAPEANRDPAPATSQHPPQPGPKPPDELARCALEVLCSKGNRRHALGISFADREARFWYFDRAGSLRTPKLTVNGRPFVRALMKFAFCNAAQLGMEDAFNPPKDNLSPPIFDRVEGWTIHVQGSTFTISEILHSAQELHGRGTAVFSADGEAAESSRSHSLPPKVVVKLSWQLTSWHDEEALYRLAAERGVQGVSHLYRSASLSRLSHGFRGRLVDATRFCDRELRAQVLGPLCIPLYRVESLDNFKKAFIALVKSM